MFQSDTTFGKKIVKGKEIFFITRYKYVSYISPLIEKYTKFTQKKMLQNCWFFVKRKKNENKEINKWINRKSCTWYRKWIAPFSWCKGKNKNGRNNTKRAEKPYFHCGSQAEKVIKSI